MKHANAPGPSRRPRRCSIRHLLLLTLAMGIPRIVLAQTTVPSDVRDTAKLFSDPAVRSARETLEKLEKATGVPVLIETIDSLDGEDIDHVAARLARRSGTQGIFVLITRKESKLEVLPSRRYAESLRRPARDKARRAFIEGFREHKYDEGLIQGIATLEAELTAARREQRVPPGEKPAAADEAPKRALLSQQGPGQPGEPARDRALSHGDSPAGGTPLIIRNQVRLTLPGARTIIAAAEEQAAAMNLKVNVAVVDDGGHLLSFDRMDGARPASGYTAITKATAAATFRQATGPIPAGTASPDPLLNLSLQLAAQASGGKITTLYGGVPVVVDGQVIGAVGVGGGTGEQDAQAARAGAQALLDAIAAIQPPPKPDGG